MNKEENVFPCVTVAKKKRNKLRQISLGDPLRSSYRLAHDELLRFGEPTAVCANRSLICGYTYSRGPLPPQKRCKGNTSEWSIRDIQVSATRISHYFCGRFIIAPTTSDRNDGSAPRRRKKVYHHVKSWYEESGRGENSESVYCTREGVSVHGSSLTKVS